MQGKLVVGKGRRFCSCSVNELCGSGLWLRQVENTREDHEEKEEDEQEEKEAKLAEEDKRRER